MRRIVLLVDGLHPTELVAELDRACGLGDAELLLVYVRGQAPRRGLDMVRHRPGGVRMPPHRARVIDEAEGALSAQALDEAERRARGLARTVTRLELEGEAGRAVVDIAARERADLIAVHAEPGHLGPAARFITDHARCGVVVLRLRA